MDIATGETLGSSSIVVEDHAGQRVYLYGHNMGHLAIKHLNDAIDEGRRLDDSEYFARILFSKMIRDSIDDEDGYGIGGSPTVGDHSQILVNPETDQIVLLDFTGKRILTPAVSFVEFRKRQKDADFQFQPLSADTFQLLENILA
jgi:hypothetical protein